MLKLKLLIFVENGILFSYKFDQPCFSIFLLIFKACAIFKRLYIYIYIYMTNVITYLDVYQAALTRRRTPKHACLQIVLIRSLTSVLLSTL
jgi:hypothetical protein